MSDIINLMKSLEDSNVLIDGVTETVKDEVKKQEGRFLSSFLDSSAASFVHLGRRQQKKSQNRKNRTDK